MGLASMRPRFSHQLLLPQTPQLPPCKRPALWKLKISLKSPMNTSTFVFFRSAGKVRSCCARRWSVRIGEDLRPASGLWLYPQLPALMPQLWSQENCDLIILDLGQLLSLNSGSEELHALIRLLGCQLWDAERYMFVHMQRRQSNYLSLKGLNIHKRTLPRLAWYFTSCFDVSLVIYVICLTGNGV